MNEIFADKKAFATMVMAVLLFLIPIVPLGYSASSNSTAYPANSKPYGLTYGDWAAKWDKWFMEIPADPHHPFKDNTGADCARNQIGPVWFIVGSSGPPVYRTCVIPAGKALAFNAIDTECSYAEDATLKSEAQLRSCAINGDLGGTAQVTVDGVPIQNLQDYKIQSPLFNFTFPQNNIFGAKPGPSQSVMDCYCIVLKPLPPGEHTVHFSGAVIANPALGVGTGFASDATYHLIVK